MMTWMHDKGLKWVVLGVAAFTIILPMTATQLSADDAIIQPEKVVPTVTKPSGTLKTSAAILATRGVGR